MNKLKGNNGFFAIKVDLAKDYDIMKWSYVYEVLKELNIPHNLRSITMSTITFGSIRVIWNEQKGEYFKLKKGIRQGDMISSSIFVLCIHKLSHVIMDIVKEGLGRKEDW